MKMYDVVGIGNAVVDVSSLVEEAFLTRMGVERGIMQLVERTRGEELYAAMSNRQQAPGGSVANTLAGIGKLGAATAFIGKVADDDLGRFYIHQMEQEGTSFVNSPVQQSALPTSRSMIVISPDGERSMNTYLGVSAELGPEDVPKDVVERARILFLEGYLYDKPKGKQAFERAARLCRAAGGRAGITLSDPFCVNRHRDYFMRLVKELDYVIGNEHEWAELYQTDTDTALVRASEDARLVVCTRGGKDVVIIEKSQRHHVAVQHADVIDATGAGDQFAAGFLYGLATGQNLERAGQMGCLAAAEVIGHIGARPLIDVKALFKAQGLA